MTRPAEHDTLDRRPTGVSASDGYEEAVARNLRAVEAHFHNENPENVGKALELYTDDIVWEAPARGQVYTTKEQVFQAYLDIFSVFSVHGTVQLRRFATDEYVLDDQIVDESVVGDPAIIPNFPYERGTRMSTRMVHIFEMRDGKIRREIAMEVWRVRGSVEDNDAVPDHCHYESYGPGRTD